MTLQAQYDALNAQRQRYKAYLNSSEYISPGGRKKIKMQMINLYDRMGAIRRAMIIEKLTFKSTINEKQD